MSYKKNSIGRFKLSCVASTVAQIISLSASAAVIPVTSSLDDNGEGCTLREAIVSANTDGNTAGGCVAGNGNDQISVPAPTVSTITLTQRQPLAITDDVQIINASSDLVRISGINNGQNSMLEINDCNVTLAGFALSSTSANQYGAAVSLGNYARLILENSSVSGNSSRGLYLVDNSTITVRNSLITNNISDYGGGIYANGDGNKVTLINSTVSGNEASDSGGGIALNRGMLTIANSTLTDNTAPAGGGIGSSEAANILIQNSIIVGNNAYLGTELHIGLGGTIESESNLLGRSNVSLNEAFMGFEPSDTDIPLTSDSAQPTELTQVFKRFLSENGGPTKTHPLVFDSPAIDAGNTAVCAARNIITDQRGRDRDERCDIGAFEASRATLVVDSASDDDLGCTLRQATSSANTGEGQIAGCDDGGDLNIISFNLPNDDEIVLTQGTGLTITADTRIEGSGAENLAIAQGVDNDSVVTINGAEAEILGLTIKNGFAPKGAGIAAINGANLELSDVVVTDNIAILLGGAVYAGPLSTVSVQNSNITNSSSVDGGGAIAARNASLIIDNSTMQQNFTSESGGAVDLGSASSATISNSTISGNTAQGSGGGVRVAGNSALQMLHTTISNNTADSRGGGLLARNATVELNNSLIAGNTAAIGGELVNYSSSAEITSNGNLFGHLTVSLADALRNFDPESHDLTATSDGNTPTELSQILKSLAVDGRLAGTHAITSISPATNAGAAEFCLGLDQLNQPRDRRCDIGSFEFQDDTCFVVKTSNGKVLTFCL